MPAAATAWMCDRDGAGVAAINWNRNPHLSCRGCSRASCRIASRGIGASNSMSDENAGRALPMNNYRALRDPPIAAAQFLVFGVILLGLHQDEDAYAHSRAQQRSQDHHQKRLTNHYTTPLTKRHSTRPDTTNQPREQPLSSSAKLPTDTIAQLIDGRTRLVLAVTKSVRTCETQVKSADRLEEIPFQSDG